MREIKFRAWDKVKKEWLLGYEMPSLGGFSMFGEMMMMGEWASLISSYFPNRLKDIELMQYTGLKDKNGVEIYEGELLQMFPNGVEPRAIWEVYWSQKHYQFRCKTVDGSDYPLEDFETYGSVGNIYQNPDLIKN